ncbi:hypothetical protein J3F84DRAFT_94427 [Trichoderma pleuroticola]
MLGQPAPRALPIAPTSGPPIESRCRIAFSAWPSEATRPETSALLPPKQQPNADLRIPPPQNEPHANSTDPCRVRSLEIPQYIISQKTGHVSNPFPFTPFACLVVSYLVRFNGTLHTSVRSTRTEHVPANALPQKATPGHVKVPDVMPPDAAADQTPKPRSDTPPKRCRGTCQNSVHPNAPHQRVPFRCLYFDAGQSGAWHFASESNLMLFYLPRIPQRFSPPCRLFPPPTHQMWFESSWRMKRAPASGDETLAEMAFRAVGLPG